MKDKYIKTVAKALLCIPIIFCMLVFDQVILPQEQIDDKIVAYAPIVVSHRNKFSTQSSKETIAIKFYTEKKHEFSLRETFIEEDEITIGRSYIFREINLVVTKHRDYSEMLMSGLNGACFYMIASLTFTAIVSLLLLKFKTNLSENGFHNIILINSFLLFVTIYVFALYY